LKQITFKTSSSFPPLYTEQLADDLKLQCWH